MNTAKNSAFDDTMLRQDFEFPKKRDESEEKEDT